MTARLVVALVALMGVGCPQRVEPPPPTWADTLRSWEAREAELDEQGKAALTALDALGKQGDASSDELALAVRGAMNELAKTRLTAVREVKSGRWTAEVATERMTRALEKAERNVELATARVTPEPEKGEPPAAAGEPSP